MKSKFVENGKWFKIGIIVGGKYVSLSLSRQTTYVKSKLGVLGHTIRVKSFLLCSRQFGDQLIHRDDYESNPVLDELGRPNFCKKKRKMTIRQCKSYSSDSYSDIRHVYGSVI